MKLTEHVKETVMGVKFNFVIFEATVPTTNYLVFFPGSGEAYNNIALLYRYGYLQQAKAGADFPGFNIIGVQAIDGTSYTDISKVLFNYLKSLGATRVVLTGLSMGGMETVSYLTKLQGRSIQDIPTSFLVICGRPAGSPVYCDSYDAPVLMVHGVDDKSHSIYQARKVRDGINSCPGRTNKVQLIEIPGGDHDDAWLKGYNINDPIVGSQVYKWVLEQLPTSTVPVDQPDKVLETYVSNNQVVYKTESGKEFKINL